MSYFDDAPLNEQAEAFLPIAKLIIEQCDFHAGAVRFDVLRNGRERGYVLTRTDDEKNGLRVFFAECRGSDQFFLWSWPTTNPALAPTIAECSTHSYEERVEVPWLRFDLAWAQLKKLVDRPSRRAQIPHRVEGFGA